MLTFSTKIKLLEAYLLDIGTSYSDEFKIDILFYFDCFKQAQPDDIRYKFLANLHTKTDICSWVDNLISRIIIKYNEDEEQLSDFIFLQING